MDTFDAIKQRRSALTDLRSVPGSTRPGGATLGPPPPARDRRWPRHERLYTFCL